MTFAPDIPGAIVFPAHPLNMKTNGTNTPKVLVLHTPEEPADNVEGTPTYFSKAHYDQYGNLVPASTHYYSDNDGDLYQMVPERHFAFANGVTRGTRPYPPDTDPARSLNWQSLSNEVEGRAATMHLTCPPGCKQWLSVVVWVEGRSRRYNIPLDRPHVIGHYEVADNRTDPGTLDIDGIVRDAQALRAAKERPPEEEPDMGMTDQERAAQAAVDGFQNTVLQQQAAINNFQNAILMQLAADTPDREAIAALRLHIVKAQQEMAGAIAALAGIGV